MTNSSLQAIDKMPFVSSNPLPSKSWITVSLAEGRIGLTRGITTYLTLRSFSYFGSITASNIYLSAYITAGLAVPLCLVAFNRIYTLACQMIGPCDKDEFAVNSNQSSLSGRLRVRCWKFIVKMEQIHEMVDSAFCRCLGIRKLEIEKGLVADKYLLRREKIRKVFWSTVKEWVVTTFTLEGFNIVTKKLGAYSFNDFVDKKLHYGMIGVLFINQLIANIRAFNAKVRIDRELNQWLKTKCNLQVAQELDLRTFPGVLDALVLERLLNKINPLGDQIKLIKMNLIDLPAVIGFDAQLRPDLKVELLPLASPTLYKDRKFNNGAFQYGNEFFPFHDLISWQYPFLTIDVNTNELICQQEMGDAESWLRLIYQGKCPLYQLNSLGRGVLSRKQLLGFSEYSDLTLIFREGEKPIPVHKIFLKLHCKRFADIDSIQENSLNCSDLNQKIVWRALEFIYERDFSIEDLIDADLAELLNLADKWEIEGLKEKLEEKLIAIIKMNPPSLLKVGRNLQEFAKVNSIHILFVKLLNLATRWGFKSLQAQLEEVLIASVEKMQERSFTINKGYQKLAEVNDLKKLDIECRSQYSQLYDVQNFNIMVSKVMVNRVTKEQATQGIQALALERFVIAREDDSPFDLAAKAWKEFLEIPEMNV